MYSQNNEDDILLAHFKPYVGRFLDIGAYDGKTFSNTYRLSLWGWSGVCIEPSEIPFNALKETYKNNPLMILDNSIVGTHREMVNLYETERMYSTIDMDYRQRYDGDYVVKRLPSITIKDVLDKYGYDFHLISIDTKGMSYLLLNQLPISLMTNLRMIVVENHPNLMVPSGFRINTINRDNTIMERI